MARDLKYVDILLHLRCLGVELSGPLGMCKAMVSFSFRDVGKSVT